MYPRCEPWAFLPSLSNVSRFYAPCNPSSLLPPPPPGMLAVAGQGGEGIEIVSKIQRREVPRGQNG